MFPGGATQEEAKRFSWRFKDIKWGHIMRYQNWSGVLLIIPAGVITLFAHSSFQTHPRMTPAYSYDATISYPHGSDTVSNSLAGLYPWLAMLASVAVIEFGLFNKLHSLTTAITAFLHFNFNCLVAFLITLAVSEVTKAVTGRLRPDFLARCVPTAMPNGAFVLNETVTCTNTDTDLVTQGRLSFPSGHASNTMCVCWFCAIYLVWSIYVRGGGPYTGHRFDGSVSARLVKEFVYALVYAWLVFVLCLSWFIGVTRIWDHMHHPSDVVGGFVLGIIMTTPCFVMTAGQYEVFQRAIDKEFADTVSAKGATAELASVSCNP